MNKVAVIEHEATPAPAQLPVTPMAMIERAVEYGAGIEVLEKLMALQERWEANRARKEFDAALADAKAEFGPILKNRRVYFEGKQGKSDTDYRHEDLAQIERQIGPILTKHGLSYRFRATSEPDQPVRVTCVVAHRDGHAEETTLSAGRDASGNKNSIQAIGSAITYLQRYTLKAALGLSVAADDDGASADEPSSATISPDQYDELQDLIDQTDTDIAAFCRAYGIAGVMALPLARFDDAAAKLRMKLAKQRGAS